jgi:hypothetical protein
MTEDITLNSITLTKGRSTTNLNPCMTAEVEIKLCRMTYFTVNNCPWKDIPTFIDTTGVIVIAGKEACMVAFLHHHKCDWWLVVWL